MEEQFRDEERKLLKPYFTNLDKPIFGLINLPEVVKGALFSRYSRAPDSLRKVLLKEFIQKPEMGFSDIVVKRSDTKDQLVAVQKAEAFYDRVLIGYGDDSVAELGGAHIAVEEVSQIAAKFIESARLGISPLEKSTRYIEFDKKAEGIFMYYRPDIILSSEFKDMYVKLCDELFETYSKILKEMLRFFKAKFPKDNNISDRAYEATIRAKACDVVRVFLPAATLTNLGLFGNGRAYEYLLTKMYAHDLDEMKNIASEMQAELSLMVPSFVKRCNDEKYGKSHQDFLKESKKSLKKLTDKIKDPIERYDEVTLVYYNHDAELNILAAMLYEHSRFPMNQCMRYVKDMTEQEKEKLIDDYLGKRKNRRHKPGRSFENAYYTFEILANYGIYRDLQRHRILTQEPQDLTTAHGYDTPPELIEAGFKEEYDEMMKKADTVYKNIYEKYPKEAQYVVPFGYKIRWYIAMNLREIFHFTELRSARQGHIDYRRVAQKIAKKVKEVHPLITKHLKFVDYESYDLERADSEKKIDKKLESVKDNTG